MRVWTVPSLVSLVCFAAAAPVAAQSSAPSATPTSIFDASYIGVCADNVSSGNTLAGSRARTQGYAGARACRDFRTPARLTISGGRAHARWGEYTLEGYATPDGF